MGQDIVENVDDKHEQMGVSAEMKTMYKRQVEIIEI